MSSTPIMLTSVKQKNGNVFAFSIFSQYWDKQEVEILTCGKQGTINLHGQYHGD